MTAKFDKLIDYQELSLYDQLIKQHIANLLLEYVKTEKGKGLSTNDLTDALLELINSVEEGAQKNVQPDWDAETGDAAILHKPVIPDVSGKLDKAGDGSGLTVAAVAATQRVNLTTGSTLTTIIGQLMKWYADLSKVAWSGSYNDLTGKPDIPTDNKSLVNGAGYQTLTDVKGTIEAYKYQTASDVAAAISAALSGEFVAVDSLPETGETGKIYLVPNGGTGQNTKDEYIWMASTKSYEMFGTTALDLSGYLKIEDVTLATNDDINALFATA